MKVLQCTNIYCFQGYCGIMFIQNTVMADHDKFVTTKKLKKVHTNDSWAVIGYSSKPFCIIKDTWYCNHMLIERDYPENMTNFLHTV